MLKIVVVYMVIALLAAIAGYPEIQDYCQTVAIIAAVFVLKKSKWTAH